MKLRLLVTFLCSFSLMACFGGMDKRGSVKSYYNGTVNTDGGSFRIGTLPEYWKSKKTKFRALLFLNKRDSSTVNISSFCGGAVDGGSLKALTQQMFRGINSYRVTDQHTEELAGRTVLKTEARGRVDGAAVFVSSYVLRMNECVFDFVYVSTPSELTYLTDFKSMVKGFQYIDGPDSI